MITQIGFKPATLKNLQCKETGKNCFTGNNTAGSPVSKVYSDQPLSDKMLASFRTNAVRFKGSDSGMGHALITLDPNSGFTWDDISQLLRIINPSNEKLVEKLSKTLRPLDGFKGCYFVKILKQVLVFPEKEKVVFDVVDKFKYSNSRIKGYNIVRDLVDVLENYDPKNGVHKQVLDVMLATRCINSADDIARLLEFSNAENIGLIKKVVEKTHKNEILNGLEVELTVKEVIDHPEKGKILDKLLDTLGDQRGPLSGILSLLETYDATNPVHDEMLDFLLTTKSKGFWGLFMNQLLEMTTVENKDKIKQIIKEAPGEGMDAAKVVIEKVKAL